MEQKARIEVQNQFGKRGPLSESGTWPREVRKLYIGRRLLSRPEEVRARIDLIERVTSTGPCPVRFKWCGDTLERITTYLRSPRVPLRCPTAEQSMTLARILERFHAAGLVHGDLHPKNVFLWRDHVVVVDWEPALHQVLNGRPSYLVSGPFHHPEDRRNGCVGTKTDMLCFVSLVSGWRAQRARNFVDDVLAESECHLGGYTNLCTRLLCVNVRKAS